MSHDPSTEFDPERPKVSRSEPVSESETFPEPAAEQPSQPDETWHVMAEQPRRFLEIPGYEILGELGRGSMGVVYKARHLGLNRTVALKMVLAGAHAGPRELARFKSEAEAVAGLNHPNVVQIFEVGEHAGLPFFTLEYCPGGSLAHRCADGPMAARDATEIVETIARGVAHAHAQGVVHRDLKPANVLLASGGREPAELVPKVTDFGLAKRVESDDGITATGAVMGTPAYMAPEQAAGGTKRVGPAADVWALGAVLYRLLTGVAPFRGESPMDTARRVLDEEPMPPRSVVPGVPRDLEVVCLKCLSKEPGKRYVSADALADDLRRWLNGVPIRARSVGRAERAWKWLMRNPAGAAAVVFLLAGVVVSTALFLRAERKAAEARAERDGKERARADEAKQRHLAEANALLAQQERDTAVGVRDFLRFEILNQADAHKQADRMLGAVEADARIAHDLTLREALDRAASGLSPVRIELRFPGQPLTQAAILRTVGDTYWGIGEYEKAAEFQGRAEALYSAALGEGHSDTLAARYQLALAHHQAGRLDEAIQLYQRTLEAWAENPDVPFEAAAVRGALAVAHVDAGRLGQAIPLFEEELKRAEETYGADHPRTILPRNNLGHVYWKVGRLEEAIRLHETALEQCERFSGEGHPSTLNCRGNLAADYESAGRPHEALRLHLTSLEQCEEIFGEDHPHTLLARHNVAAAYEMTGHTDEAIRLYERTLEGYARTLGEDHHIAMLSLNNLAYTYWKTGRLNKSVPLFERALRLREGALGPAHPDTLQARTNLGVNYKDAGRPEEAIPLLEDVLRRTGGGPDWLKAQLLWVNEPLAEAYDLAGMFEKSERIYRAHLDQLRERFGREDVRTSGVLALLGTNLTRQKKHAQAEESLRECLRIREKAMPASWLTANARSMLGETLLDQGEHAEAEDLLVAGHADVKTAFETGKPGELPPPALRTQRLLEATARLVRLYDTSDSRQASGWKAEWAELFLSRRPVPLR